MGDNWLKLPYTQNNYIIKKIMYLTILQDIYTSHQGGFFLGGGEVGGVGGFTTQKYPLRKRILKTSKDNLYMYFSGIFLSCFC